MCWQSKQIINLEGIVITLNYIRNNLKPFGIEVRFKRVHLLPIYTITTDGRKKIVVFGRKGLDRLDSAY